MFSFEKVRTIFFDYDGTLHNSMKIYGPAFRKAYSYLVENALAKQRDWKDKEISHWLGYNSQDMWEAFMPELPDEIKRKCRDIIGNEMKLQIEQGKSVLYDGALETLEYLKNKGYKLVFISNCRLYYRDAHNKQFALDQYFDDLICSEEHDFVPKHEILAKVKNKYPEEMAIVGDRYHDMEAGRRNKIYTIGCRYGFPKQGELDEADLIIDDIRDLKKYF